jgi:hypothetical protein
MRLGAFAERTGTSDPLNASLSAKGGDALEHAVGPFRPLDRNHSPRYGNRRLSDIKLADRTRRTEREVRVTKILVGRLRARMPARRYHQLPRDFVGADNSESPILEEPHRSG